MKSCPTLNNTIIKGDHEKNKEYVLTAGSGTFDSSVFYMRSSSYYNNATYAIINNVYIQAAGSFGLENAMYIYPGFKPDESLHILTGSGRVIANLSDVISSCSLFTTSQPALISSLSISSLAFSSGFIFKL